MVGVGGSSPLSPTTKLRPLAMLCVALRAGIAHPKLRIVAGRTTKLNGIMRKHFRYYLYPRPFLSRFCILPLPIHLSAINIGLRQQMFYRLTTLFKKNCQRNRCVIVGRKHHDPFISGCASDGRIGKPITVVIRRYGNPAGPAQ